MLHTASVRSVQTIASIALAANMWSAAAMAQTAPAAGEGLEQIVVTATRRSERLEDVPISVTAMSQEKIDAQGLKNIDDLTRLTPGVAFTRNGNSATGNYNDEASDISIRGIDSSAGASTTAIYIDDTPIQSRHIGFGAVNAYPALFDVDRVEVLRGPQGTLFGAGAEGGALRFITPTPGLRQYSGYVRSEVSSTEYGAPSYEAGAAVGGPIIDDKLGFRVSASFRRDGGWVDRVNYTRAADDFLTPPTYAGTTDRDANWQQTETFRLALKWQVSDAVSIMPSIYYQRLHINDTSTYWQALSDPQAGVYRNGNALTDPSTDPFYLAAIKLDWDLGAANLTSNTAYFSRSQHSVSDYTQFNRALYSLLGYLQNEYPQAGDGGYSLYGDEQNDLFEEIRLAQKDAAARIGWNTGLFLSRTDDNVVQQIYDPTLNPETLAYTQATTGTAAGICSSAVPCPGGYLYNGPEDRIVEKQIALFGEVSFKIFESLKATAGVRVSKVDISGRTVSGGQVAGTPLMPLTVLTASSSEKPVTPKFVLSYQPDRNDLFYLSAAKGYRSGGINTPLTSACSDSLISVGLPAGADGQAHVPAGYSSDSLWSYEIGAKNTLLNGTLQINSSMFVIDWKNIQQSVYLAGCGEQFAANLGSVRSEGGDVDIVYKPLQPLTLGLTVAYTDAYYARASCAGTLEFNGSICAGPKGSAPPIVSEGDRLLGAPWTVLASGEYAAPFGALGGRTGYVRFDYQRTTAQTALLPYQDFHNAAFDSTIPGLPATKNLSLRAGMRFSGWDLSVFADNVTDDHPLLVSSRDIGSNCYTGAPCGAPGTGANTDNVYYGRGVRPRTIGITATYHY